MGTTFLSVLSIVPRHCARLTDCLHPQSREINAVLIPPRPIALPPRRLRRAGGIPTPPILGLAVPPPPSPSPSPSPAPSTARACSILRLVLKRVEPITRVVGEATIPLSELRLGYRSVPLELSDRYSDGPQAPAPVLLVNFSCRASKAHAQDPRL